MTAGGVPLVEELTPVPDPLVACEQLAGMPYRVLLDSARDPARLGRYSFLTADPSMLVQGKGQTVTCISRTRGEPDSGAAPPDRGNALEVARALLAPHLSSPLPELPPFQGGFAGYIAYDWGSVLERLPAPRYDDLAIPDLTLGLYDWVIAWDHLAGRAWIVSTGIPAFGDARESRASERLHMVKQALGIGSSAGGRDVETTISAVPPTSWADPVAPSFDVPEIELARTIGLRSSFTRAAYLDAVQRVREYILAGDIFQANLSQRFEAPLREPPWTIYRRLRAINPAPFAAYLDFGDVVIASASPERFLAVSADGAVEARPIKGTRPRGIGPEHDAALGRALFESEKDRAENLMIVDLLRNDISRVCAPASVRAPELFVLEHYATVHHLVSTVVGRLQDGRDAIDLLCAAFPGGSITGAPKVRAMEIIAELERSRRGVYCGTIGYLSASGALDSNIVIRTYLVRAGADGPRVYFSAGGGIVADSDPEDEYHETLDKARALIAALAA